MATTPASELSDGPVLSVINKRLRALRKKQNRILQMEESVSKGKILNKEQEETLRSKSTVIAAIDELEKLRQPLAAAVAEEINQVSAVSNTDTSIIESSKVEDLLKLLYFGHMFDVESMKSDFVTPTMLTRTMERACCLSYDCMPDDESSDVMDLLGERDLDLISTLSGLVVSRPVNSPLSHKHALQKCIEHAKLWLSKSEQPIEVNSDATYAGLRSKLDKIIGSLYFTTDPVKVEAAAGKYGSYSVPVEEHVEPVPVDVPLQVDAPSVQYEQKDVEAASSQTIETSEIHVSNVELQQGEQDNVVSQQHAEPEEFASEAEGVDNMRNAEFIEQQSVPRRSYQNQNYRGNRGGSVGDRRGYSNGRGGRGRGGSYQNGRSQYYDQSGTYQQRNYSNYRGRGGRGTGGGVGYNHYASGDQPDSYSAADIR
ncbi:putative triose phosphate/phosphate translocator TPT, chloroplastic-like [Capsicum annuum]|nr:putative triose phosphate/phosphate translocator TPT, chloroplastic-like [Capsicum annuum]KAF3666423.1 putative triose phosphate/phosphate translocator TPT, chloroplastic-like [Capsicum annuum]